MADDRTAESVWGWQGQLKAATDRNKHVLGKEIFSDVTFRVGPREGPTVDMKAHKLLLAMGSLVFETMFYGAIAESGPFVRIIDIDEKTFGILLRYIYHDEMPVFDNAVAFSTLYATKKYGLPVLKAACEDYLKTHTTAKDCLAGFVQAKAYDEQDLAEFFIQKIDFWAGSVLKSADFKEISIDTLKEIFSRDTLRVKEHEVLDAAYRWAQQRCTQRKIAYIGENCRDVLEDAMFLIRFALLEDEYLAIAAKSQFLLAEEFKQLYLFRFINEKLAAKFITKKRMTSVMVTICRSDPERLDWGYDRFYSARSTDVVTIRITVTSVTDAKGKKLDSASVSLLAVGISGSRVMSEGDSVAFKMYQHSEGPAHTKEMQEFRQVVEWSKDGSGIKRKKLELKKPVPLTIGQSYIVSARLMGTIDANSGHGKNSVTASAGDYEVTVRFADAVDPERKGLRCTEDSDGQFSKFYLEIAE